MNNTTTETLDKVLSLAINTGTRWSYRGDLKELLSRFQHLHKFTKIYNGLDLIEIYYGIAPDRVVVKEFDISPSTYIQFYRADIFAEIEEDDSTWHYPQIKTQYDMSYYHICPPNLSPTDIKNWQGLLMNSDVGSIAIGEVETAEEDTLAVEGLVWEV
jgi:hypothetical protein